MNDAAMDEIRKEIEAFVSGCQSVVLASIDNTHSPLASYAPFFRDEAGQLYVYVSQLSAHTDNLANGQVSAMMIEDESSCQQIYARKRLVLQCRTSLLETSDPQHEDILARMQVRHGEVIRLLSSLPDFLLFRLAPVTGTFVKGFGKAYRVNALISEIHHIDAESLGRQG